MFIVEKLKNMDIQKRKKRRNGYPMDNITPWVYIMPGFKIYKFSQNINMLYTIL